MILPYISIGYDDNELTKVTAEIWEHSDTAATVSRDKTHNDQTVLINIKTLLCCVHTLSLKFPKTFN